MYKDKAILIGIFSFLMLSSLVSVSEAELWDLIIDLNVEQGAIHSGEDLTITGRVVDHGYQPIRGAEVSLRAGSDTTKVFTDPWGNFRAEFQNFERIPGTYTVNVVATWYEMTGLSTIEFQIKGELSKVSILQEQLSTEHARKYLGANEGDFEKDPIGQALFKYYHGLLDELILEKKRAEEPLVEQARMEEQRRIARELREQAIEERRPGAGVIEGWKYDDMVKDLSPEIKQVVASQIDFTKNIFEEAQKIREAILANGGTNEQARQAYLEIITIPKETLEQFNEEKTDSENDPVKDSENEQTDEESER